MNKSRMEIGRKQRLLFLIVLLFIAIAVFFVLAASGNYCLTSPCSCGTACQDGGNEAGNGYNTIDDCQDGIEDSYEYVHDITITNINGTAFSGYDIIMIDAHVECDLLGDEISFVYHNGTDWVPFYNVVCAVAGKTHYYRNLTLDNVEGNHTIRIALAFLGDSNMTCAYDYDTLYSDTDDVSFFVHLSTSDTIPPSVENITPAPGTTFMYSPGLVVNISANVTDNFLFSNISANITWGAKNQIIPLTNISGSMFLGNFSNTSDIIRYNITFLAYDNSSNLNNTVMTYFYVNITPNISITYPIDGALYEYKNLSIEYEMDASGEVNESWIEIINSYYIEYGSNKKISLESSGAPVQYEQANRYSNLSQSFYVTQDTHVDKIFLKLKKNTTGTNNSRIEIRNNTGWEPSNVTLAYADLNESLISTDFSWVNFTLNQTIVLQANTTYWLVLTPNGTNDSFYSWESIDDTYADGYFSQNDSKDLLFIVYDKFRFNVSFEPQDSDHYFQAYANTSLGMISSPIIQAFFDEDPPEILECIISPDDEFSQDPGATINVSANVTDNTVIEKVILQYKLQNETEWTNETMVNSSGLFTSNLSSIYESNVSIQIYVEDTSQNYETLCSQIIEIKYDYNWTVYPPSINTSGVLIDTNRTISNLTLVSNSDYGIVFDISSVSDREILFNDSVQDTITLSPNSNSTLSVKAFAASSPRIDEVTINILGLNQTAVPSSKQMNFTLVSTLSGPYLYAVLLEYPSTATQGDHVGSIRARISNLGNETSNNLTMQWTLPTGWSSRDTLQQNQSTLSSGGIETLDYKISADVALTAATGQQTILFEVNSSEGIYSSDSRNVIVTSYSSGEDPETPVPSSSPSSSKSSSPVVIRQLDFALYPTDLKVPRGLPYRTSLMLFNNISNRDFDDVEIELEGIFKSYFNLTPMFIREFDKGLSTELIIDIFLPEYYPEGITELTLTLNPKNTEKIVKNINLVVYDPITSLDACLSTSANIISRLNISGFNVRKIYSDFLKAQVDYKEENYDKVRIFCSDIEALYAEYTSQLQDILALEEVITNLKSKGYKASDLDNFLKLINETLYKGDLDESAALMRQANVLIEATEELEKPLPIALMEFYNLNRTFILLSLILCPLMVYLVSKVVYISSTENRIRSLEDEKIKLISMMEDIQRNFFSEHIVDLPTYQTTIENYRKRLGEVEIDLVKNKLKKKNYLKPVSEAIALETQRKEIRELWKRIQEDYYVKKVIDFGSYSKIEAFYTSMIAQVDQKLGISQKITPGTNQPVISAVRHPEYSEEEQIQDTMMMNLPQARVLRDKKLLPKSILLEADTDAEFSRSILEKNMMEKNRKLEFGGKHEQKQETSGSGNSMQLENDPEKGKSKTYDENQKSKETPKEDNVEESAVKDASFLDEPKNTGLKKIQLSSGQTTEETKSAEINLDTEEHEKTKVKQDGAKNQAEQPQFENQPFGELSIGQNPLSIASADQAPVDQSPMEQQQAAQVSTGQQPVETPLSGAITEKAPGDQTSAEEAQPADQAPVDTQQAAGESTDQAHPGQTPASTQPTTVDPAGQQPATGASENKASAEQSQNKKTTDKKSSQSSLQDTQNKEKDQAQPGQTKKTQMPFQPLKPKNDLEYAKKLVISPEEYFFMHDGRSLKSLKELYNALFKVDETLFSYHVNHNKNDFACWVRDVYGLEELAEKMSATQSRI
ncbi:hypothetical protein JXC34_03215, partial [Candidatus Woesearchaeota archaeon]|nr:hypothetical protein [Candidatus Woesearchaeota archaeon]